MSKLSRLLYSFLGGTAVAAATNMQPTLPIGKLNLDTRHEEIDR